MMRLRSLLWVPFVLLLFPLNSSASLITISFTGGIGPCDNSGVCGGPRLPLNGFYEYDTTSPDLDPAERLYFYQAITRFEFLLGSSLFTGTEGSIRIADDAPDDVGSDLSHSSYVVVLRSDPALTIDIFDGSGHLFDGPSPVLSAAAFDQMISNGFSGANAVVENRFGIANLTRVPEPSSLFLFGLSVASIGVLRGRHRSRP